MLPARRARVAAFAARMASLGGIRRLARAGLCAGTRSGSVSWGFARHVLEPRERQRPARYPEADGRPPKGSAPFGILRQGTALDPARRRNRLAITGRLTRPEPGIMRHSPPEPRERQRPARYPEADGRPGSESRGRRSARLAITGRLTRPEAAAIRPIGRSSQTPRTSHVPPRAYAPLPPDHHSNPQ